MAVFEAIQTQVCEISVSTVSFTVPTSGYRHLMIHWARRGTLQSTGLTPYMTIDSGTAGNYYRYGWSVYWATNYDQKSNAEANLEMGSITGTSNEGPIHETGQVWLYNYLMSGTQLYKCGMYWSCMIEAQRANQTYFHTRAFLDGANTTDIVNLQFFDCCASEIEQGSEFTLYGIKDS